MRSLRRLFFALQLAILLLPDAVPATVGGDAQKPPPRDDALAHIESLPASNPYRTILLRYQTLPSADREYLTAWSLYETPEGEPPRTLDPRQQQLARELSSALLAAAGQPDTTASDWPPLLNPAAPEDPASMTIPGVSTVRSLARLVTTSAASLPPSEAAPVYAAVAQLGRRQRCGVTLGEQAAGAGIEALAQTEVARRLSEFSPDDLSRLSLAWTNLQTPPSTRDLLDRELRLVLRPTVALHLAPGLRALLAQAEAADAEQAPADPDAGFTRDLRLSALLRVAENEHHIVLEDIRRHESFTLRSGQTVHNIELLSIDYENRLAVIRRGKREALVHLESKRIVERASDDDDRRDKSLSRQDRKLLDRIRAHPGGLDGFIREVIVANENHLRRQAELAELQQCPSPEPVPTYADGFFLVANPSFGSNLRTLNRHATQAAMLQSALRIRLDQFNPSEAPAPPVDPWGDTERSPFTREPTPDGGFLLRSRYEGSPGEPLAYKFASSDAGFFRVSKP